MDSKKIIEKLVSLANKQQQLIYKLAQQQGQVPPPGEVDARMSLPDQAAPPPPTALSPVAPSKTEARTIINSLPPAIQNHLVNLEVHNGQVLVKWKSPVSDAVFKAVTNAVQKLQQQNALPGASYKVVEKA
jgi:hypothetical protein